MLEPTAELLTDILGQVLQESAFIFAEPDDEPAVWQRHGAGRPHRLRVDPRRRAAPPHQPAGRLRRSPPTCWASTRGEEADANGRAAVSELLNVLGGAFLTRYFGTAVPSQLGLPTTEILPAPPPEAARRSCAASVRLESGEPMVLELDLEDR